MKPENGESLSLYLAISAKVVSVILVKDHEGSQHPVYYVSKILLDAEARYSHLEKLILDLIMASAKHGHYFETHTIIVKSNISIEYVLRKTEIAGRMAKWIVKLNAYDIKYEPRTVIKSEALADFVADFSSDLQREAELEVQQLEKTKDPWTLFTDGASNVKGTGQSTLLKSPQGDIIPQSIACEFQTTNHEAEYEALIAGLQLANNMRIRYLQVYVDSLSITNHYNSSYTVKCEKLIKYLEIVRKLADSFAFSVYHRYPGKKITNLGSFLKMPEDVKNTHYPCFNSCN